MLIAGVDPGLHGALAICDEHGKLFSVDDMPTWNMSVSAKKRLVIESVALADMLECWKYMLDVRLIVIEAVGGRPKQGASAAFNFGDGNGQLKMACLMLRIPVEYVVPQTWKRVMRLPGKMRARAGEDGRTPRIEQTPKELETAIIHRADELFPEHRHEWRGKRGGFRVDRAEAAMLARFGVEHFAKGIV